MNYKHYSLHFARAERPRGVAWRGVGRPIALKVTSPAALRRSALMASSMTCAIDGERNDPPTCRHISVISRGILPPCWSPPHLFSIECLSREGYVGVVCITVVEVSRRSSRSHS